jgi:hypothetical protein
VKDLSLIFASTERQPGAGVREMFQLFKMGALQYDWLAITQPSSIPVAVYVLFRGRVKNNDSSPFSANLNQIYADRWHFCEYFKPQ